MFALVLINFIASVNSMDYQSNFIAPRIGQLIEKAKEQNKIANKERKILQDQNLKLGADLENLNQQKTNLEKEIERNKNTIDQLKTSFTTNQKQLTKVTTEKEELKKEISKLSTDLGSLNQQKTNLEKEIEKNKKTMDESKITFSQSLEQMQNKYLKEYQTLELENQGLKEKSSKLEEIIRKQALEIANLNQASSIINEDFEKFIQENEKLFQENDKLKKEKEQIEANYTSSSQDNEKVIYDLKLENNKVKKENEKMKQEITDQTTAYKIHIQDY